MKVVHLTSVHPRHDIRVFRKQCRTLAAAGYEVNLVVADGKGDELADGIQILDAGAPQGRRLKRMTVTTRQVYDRGRALNADLYHLHDPELLPVALRLKRDGRKVIFDSHEDFPADILTKPYLNPVARIAIAGSFSLFERYAVPRLDQIIAATPAIRRKFERLGCAAIDINNYPLLEELSELIAWDKLRSTACYIGAMTSIRGVPELVDAMALTGAGERLAIAGNFTEAQTGERCKASPGWVRVDDHGFVGRDRVREIMENAFAGVVTFLPAPNHTDSQPNKMFEYMSAGIPVIGSNFPLWREIIEGNACGVCVDPTSPPAIARALDQLYGDQETGREMGARGRAAVLERYNWDSEGKKLVALYERLIGR
jgi:glycosyltransferase involved in cell wall biosynthesis